MKLRKFVCLFAILCFLLVSCEKTPNMTELLAYEKQDITFHLHIWDETDFSVKLTLADTSSFLFTDGKLAGIGAEFDANGKVNLTYEDFKISFPETELSKIQKWHELFRLSEKNLLWKIKKETLSGLSVYTCRTDDLTIYIDAATHLPLKITQGDVIVNILASENPS